MSSSNPAISEAVRDAGSSTPSSAFAGSRPTRAPAKGQPLLVQCPCPRARPAPPPPTEFEIEVLQTARLAAYTGLNAITLAKRARRYGVAFAGAVVGTVVLAPWETVWWLAILPASLTASLGWQWAVLNSAARRLRREAGIR
jgi:hypothetical protein